MTGKERAFTWTVIVFAALFGVLAIVSAIEVFSPHHGRSDWFGMEVFCTIYASCMTIALAVAATKNLRTESFGTARTVVQCIILLFLPFGILLTVWGIILLIKKYLRQRQLKTE